MTTAAPHAFEAITVDVLWRPGLVRPVPAKLPKDHTAARLQLIQQHGVRLIIGGNSTAIPRLANGGGNSPHGNRART